MICLPTYHCHTTFSDGRSNAEEMILRAIELGCEEIGISDHSPLPNAKWTMTDESLSLYVDSINSLKEKYKGKIKISLGLELDYNTELTEEKRAHFDYIIGSVHSVYTDDGEVDVDGSLDKIKEAIDKHFSGDAVLYAEAYFKRVANVYNKTKCDIIGHFDLLTKFIERDGFLPINDLRYKNARDKAFSALLDSPAVFEINTGAISRGYRTTPYPDEDILKMIKQNGRTVVINSDSHSKETLDCAYEQAKALLKRMGITSISRMDDILKLTRK